MRSRVAPATALALGLLAGALAHAGSLTVRDATGAWTVTEDPQADANDFLLKHLVDGTRPDERFGQNGQTRFSIGGANDPPASVRVDASRRTWMVGASLAGNQPQPVVARFAADGRADLRWGVQGKVQMTPAGVAVRPHDVLPLADGSVLVAGEVADARGSVAAVFHLQADGSLDRGFGNGGVWQRPSEGQDEVSLATSLAASTDGLATVAVAVRGGKAGAELWSLSDVGLAVIQRKPLDDTSDAEDLRVEWATDHWVLASGGGPTGIVPPALLANRPPVAAVAAAASDPGGGAFNPFAGEAASAAAAATDDTGLPWTGIGVALAGIGGVAGAIVMRSRKPAPVLRKPPGR